MRKKKSREARPNRTPNTSRRSKPPERAAAKGGGDSTPPQYLEGILKIHRDGYGFVLAEQTGVNDVFIPARRMAGAMNGDRVIATVRSNPRDSRLEGAITEIKTRGNSWIIGRLQKSGYQTVAVVSEKGRSTEFIIPSKKMNGAELGQSVGLTITKYPEEGQLGIAEVVQIFENRGTPKTEVDIVILKHQLPREFPDDVLREADDWRQRRDIVLDEGRRDLRKLPFVTIDGETAKDFDDAICVIPEGNGYRLWVSIADVSHYVTPGSALDRESFKRGTSVYFPDQCIPMLPEALSNDLCSLRPKEDRLTFTCEMFLDAEGVPKSTDVYKSVIHSQARLTYKQVARALVDQIPEVREPLTPLLPMLTDALELSRKIRKQRFARGSIDFDMPEPEIQISFEDGSIENIIKAERNVAHFLIEEFMIAANEAVARFITQKKAPGVYRVHGEPDPEKVKNFQVLLHNLGFNINFPPNPKPSFFNGVLHKVADHAEQKLIQHILLRSMKQAVYSEKNVGHFGLASTCYTHFTSPIRRYPDLMVHRILEGILRQGAPRSEEAREARTLELANMAGHCSRRERVAMEAEWEAIDLQKALFMQKHVGETLKGVVSRIAKFGFFVELFDFFVEGLVLLEDLEDDYYLFDEKKHRLRGRKGGKVFKIGTEVTIKVAKVDIEARQVLFALSDGI
ncbi:MAG: ribonuclease R [Deltaproteobacteria bacterium]|nr:ribonuclease R [Deltaproteobacteria bacterium]